MQSNITVRSTPSGLDEYWLENITSLALAERSQVVNPLWQDALIRLASAAAYLKLLRQQSIDHPNRL